MQHYDHLRGLYLASRIGCHWETHWDLLKDAQLVDMKEHQMAFLKALALINNNDINDGAALGDKLHSTE